MHPNLDQLIEKLRDIPTPVTMADPDLDDMPLVGCNQAFLNLVQYREADIIGQNCRFLQGETRDQPARAEIRRAIEAGHRCETVLTNFRGDGSRFDNLLIIEPLRNRTGKVLLFIGCQFAMPETVVGEHGKRQGLMPGKAAADSEDIRREARRTMLGSVVARVDLALTLAHMVPS